MGFGDDKVMQPQEGFTPEAYSWNNAMLQITDGRADTWYQDLNPTPIEATLSAAELGGPEEREHRSRFAYAFFDENAKNALPDLEIDFDDLGEQKPIEDTVIGGKLLRVLSKLGVSWAYNERRAISHENSIEWKMKDEGVAQFQNHFGIPVPQRFRVFVKPDGKETLVWSTELLIATREYLHESERYVHSGNQVTKIQQSAEYLKNGGMSFGRWSERIHLPVFMKSLFFLAETPFPSTALVTMPRTIAFKDVPPANMPRPFIYFERNAMAIGPFEKTGGSYNWAGSLFPTVMHGGWLFTNEDETELETSLIVASNGISAISTILEDGFHNYQRDDYPAPYDEVLYCANVFDRSFGNGLSANGHSKWVPGTRIGFLIKDTEISFHKAVKSGNGKESRRELWALNDDGAGQYVAAAANNLSWYFFMPEIAEDQQSLPIYERILLQAARLKVKNDSVNCLSNLGILNYMAYKTERAIELFNMVLDDPDNYSDNEALFYLIRIYEQLGETSKADEYRRRYAEVEPYGWPLQDQIPLSSVSDADSEDSTPKPQTRLAEPVRALAQFCGGCGKHFTSDSDKFCGGCGRERKNS
jgi:tetratricopeptide (TPR) repeat protein